MVHYSAARIDELIAEDVPYFDLTTHVLGIGEQLGRIEFFTREACILAGTDAATGILKQLGATIVSSLPSGAELKAGQTFMVATGPASVLHEAWKVCLNCFDHLSAVATKTRTMVDAAHAVSPACEILTTRKSMPGTKDLMMEAILAGGAFPHRLGLSETVLIFDHHITFAGGFEAFLVQLPSIKSRCIEKKLFIEANAEQALRLATTCVDGIQLDKIPPRELTQLVRELRGLNPNLILIGAGGINSSNAALYAATGVDGLATTACFSAAPLDMSVRMHALS